MQKIILLFVSILIISSSCYDFKELNTDPNYPTQTHPSLLLTNVSWTAFSEIGTSPLYASRCLVQTNGENREQYYKWDRGSFSYYANLRDVTKLQEEAERIGSNGYLALSHFFRAYYFYKLTLTFGDVPYSEALQGESASNFTPVYDRQEDVFNGILAELSLANDLLSKEHLNLDGDIVFGGNPKKWQKAVNAFRLKVLLTLSRKDGSFPVREQFQAIVAAQPLMQSVSDNAQLVYIDQQDNRYPRFNDSDFGSGMFIDSTYIALLKDLKDPRLFTFCSRTPKAEKRGLAIDDFNAYDGGDPTAPYANVNAKAADTTRTVSKPNERFYKDPTNEPSILIGYAEQELILAEASVRKWITDDARVHYDAGIRASFQFYERYAKGYAQYLTAEAATNYMMSEKVAIGENDTDEQIIEKIITQRYIPSFFQGNWNAFFEHLRTGYPAFKLSTGMKVPQRWMYPQREYNNNAVNVGDAIVRQFGEQESIRNTNWWLE